MCLNWPSGVLFARHWAEADLDGNMVMFVEKAHCDMGVAAKGKASSVVSLKYDDDEVKIIETELKICMAEVVVDSSRPAPSPTARGPADPRREQLA